MRCIIYSANLFQVVIGRPLAGKLLPVFITVHNSSSLWGAVCALHQKSYFSMATTGLFYYVCRWHDVLEKKKKQQFCNVSGSVHDTLPWQECKLVLVMSVMTSKGILSNSSALYMRKLHQNKSARSVHVGKQVSSLFFYKSCPLSGSDCPRQTPLLMYPSHLWQIGVYMATILLGLTC